jgi:S-adenosylmethionine/arginine decarboxylase-like enzyme
VRDLAPDVTRQRLLVEGFYTRDVDESVVREFLRDLPVALELRTYGEATVHAPGGAGRADNEGFDAFVPLIDSGISLYVWSERRFLAVVVFTCKAFDVDRAVDVTRDFFALSDHEHSAF